MSTISAGTTSTTGIIVSSDTSGNLVLNPTNFLSATPNSLGTGRVPAEQFYRLDSALAGANAIGAQSIFGVGVTLVGSTVYQFEGVYALNRSAGTTSHSIGVGFGGTATLNNIAYQMAGQYNSLGFTSTTSAIANTLPWFVQTASNTVLITGITSAPTYLMFLVTGTVSVNVGGTFIPQYTLSATPGGAYSTQAGSYFKISPLAASGSNVNIGSWA